MTLLHPLWLVLAIPVAIAMIAWPASTKFLRAIRAVIAAAIILAMAGLTIPIRSRAGTVVVVADRSLSMPQQADAAQREIVGTLQSKRPVNSKFAVVSFGRDARVETPPGGQAGNFSMPSAQPESNLSGGLETALSLIPPDSPGSIVLLTDGRWTGRDPSAAMLAAADRGVAIDYRLMERTAAGDLAIERVDPPSSVAPGEPFAIHATIRSPIEQDAAITLRRGTTTIAAGKQHLNSGANRVVFRDRARAGGLLSYTLTAEGDAKDPLPENNQAAFLVGVSGPRSVLVASGSSSSHLTQLLASSGVAAEAVREPQLTLDTLSNHSAVVLENIAADKIGINGMQTLASWVANAGGGLVITGGRSSFASGGYFRSPLEPILPVSMELRREHRKLRMSIVIAMDRSGSMAVPAGGGRTKMDLADVAASQVLDLMSPQDELGVVAVDSSAHIIADLDPIEGRNDLRQRIMSIESEGGGIFIFEALSTAAKMLLTAGAQTRHILLFADAADSEEPGAYKELLEQCAKANITVSVIGLGTENDSDAGLLKDIANRGGGQVYFTDNPEDLPRLFAQDTFVVARSAFVDETTPVKATPALFSLAGRTFNDVPSIGGFNLCYLRDGASLSIVTTDDYHAPVLASWNAGLGRVAAFTGEVDGEYTGPLAKWPQAASLEASVVRWAAGAESPLPNNMLVTQTTENGVCRIDLQLDPERTKSDVIAAPEVTTIAGTLGHAPVMTRKRMSWKTPDDLQIEVPLSADLTYVSTVDVPGAGRITLPAVRLPYPAEYAPVDEGQGRRTLERLARATGGAERIDLSGVWSSLVRRRQPASLTGWLIAIAIALLLLEVLERRTRMVTSLEFARERSQVAAPRVTKVATVQEAAPPPPPPIPEANALLDALGRANRRAKRKM